VHQVDALDLVIFGGGRESGLHAGRECVDQKRAGGQGLESWGMVSPNTVQNTSTMATSGNCSCLMFACLIAPLYWKVKGLFLFLKSLYKLHASSIFCKYLEAPAYLLG